jgi:hypothetical protein
MYSNHPVEIDTAFFRTQRASSSIRVFHADGEVGPLRITDFGIIWLPKLEFFFEEHYFLRGIPDRGDDLFACMQVFVIVGSNLF